MRKIVLMASMLAMVLLVASPAMAQTAEQSASAGDNSNINQQICQNVIGDINVEGGDNVASQYNAQISQYGDNENAQAIAQENNTTVNVVQSCIQNAQQNTGDNVDQDQNVINPSDDQYVAPDDPAEDQYVAPDDPADVIVEEGDKVIVEGDTVFVKNVFFEEGDQVIITEADKKVFVEKVVVEGGEKVVKVEAPAVEAPAADQYAAPEAPAPEAEEEVTVLPDTGGASLFTLGAGALLVAGGLLARRIVR